MARCATGGGVARRAALGRPAIDDSRAALTEVRLDRGGFAAQPAQPELELVDVAGGWTRGGVAGGVTLLGEQSPARHQPLLLGPGGADRLAVQDPGAVGSACDEAGTREL